VSWGDLLRALAEEAEREAGALRSGAEQEASRALEESRSAAEERRRQALAEARARHEASARRALADERRERERVLLGAAREVLEDVRAEALARAIAAAPARLPALAEGLAAEAGERDAEWTVDPGGEEALHATLVRLGRAAPIQAAPVARGGPEALVEGRVVLDATAAARLERAWPELEPRLCALLFEESDGDV
jgi:V/A-type H+-transporting ATPase subunit E